MCDINTGMKRLCSLFFVLFYFLHGAVPARCFVVAPTGRCPHRPQSGLAVSTSSDTQNVVYQKVVRCPKNLPDTLFLGYLVEFLQERFEIPERLPMVYEKKAMGNPDSILRINSPLSTGKLDVSVVGIFTDDSAQVPNMAMVSIRKQDEELPPMMANLFQDSEKKILKALEIGLDKFSAGRIDNLGEHEQQRRSVEELEAAVMSELVEDDQPAFSQSNPKGFIDAEIQTNISSSKEQSSENSSETSKKRTKEKQMAALETMNKTPDAEPIGLEFAVMAAKQAQANRKKSQDFAIREAQKISKQKQKNRMSKTVSSKSAAAAAPPPSPATSPPRRNPEVADPENIDLSVIRPPALDPNISGVQRSFMATISRPSDRIGKTNQQSRKQTEQPSPTKEVTVKNKARTAKGGPTDSTASSRKDAVRDESRVVDSNEGPAKMLNLSVRENEREPEIGATGSPDGDKVRDEIIKGAQEALSEISKQGKDMTPEEMLADVMKFGEEQDRQEAAGTGFVSGAFEKAKEILQDQRTKRNMKIDSLNDGAAPAVGVRELSPDEELRQMFAAGERLAEGRITTVESPVEDGEARVDQIIDSDKSVPRYGRVLDDELVELQVRINKSPGEKLDGPQKNPMLDVLSGPEVYDPNVDPETAVNWPGALPGTKATRLPMELEEAVKQAKFAAEALMNVKETTMEDGEPKYTIGDRDMTEKQMIHLKMVVQEAVEIGLIDDPLQVAEEASRLQMLLDELLNQKDRVREIATNYADLLLSDNFVLLVKHRLNKMAERDLEALRHDDSSLKEAHALERELLSELVLYAQLLLKETQALGAELESQQLELIRSICKVAMDPSHKTEEETATALSDAVRDMRPLLDDSFVAYLKYAIAEEEGKLARAGVLDDPDHNQWLFVLRIVQQGVYAELAKGINRYLEHIWYILRMETPVERRMLLEKLVDEMPTLDVRPFVRVVENIAGSLGDSVRGEFDGTMPLGEMTNKILQLHRDVKEVLPPERIAEKSRDADEWAAKQKERLMEQRNITKQRLEGSQSSEYLDAEIESFGRRGDVERFD